MVKIKKAQNKKSEILSFYPKRAQMKIQQMAFMLMAVTLFFILVGMFVLVWRFSGLRGTAEELEQKNAMLLVTKLANSPEFSCGTWEYRSSCIDTDKVMMLKDSISKYSGFWGSVSNIKIEKNPSEARKECTMSNYPNCNTINLFSKEIAGIPKSTFVALCRKESDEGEVYDKCELGKLLVFYGG